MRRALPWAGRAADIALAAFLAWSVLWSLVTAGFILWATQRAGTGGFLALAAGAFWPPLLAGALFLARSATAGSAEGALGLARLGWAGVFSLAFAAGLALVPGGSFSRSNELGLIVTAAAHSVEVQDYSGASNKDDYPVCRFEHNSLGFRDDEPSFGPKGRLRRVLVVGDSFVWGDGIPDNSQTIASLLRASLEDASPGGFEVLGAAYPGLGLYGYSRFIETLAPLWSPDVVVVGYLGEADHDPFDAQALLESIPRRGWLRNPVLNTRAAQRLHEASVRSLRTLWRQPENAGRFSALAEDLARKAREGRYRLIFLSYHGPWTAPAGSENLVLPESLRYQSRASDLWYGKDAHPKPKLNALLARMLAERIAGRQQTR
ncbi:MAG: hypothetical protein HY924_07335 [Elusimicrobia bacterium]|nr:hypothetical protein [Elusimicrobiota bacterium]